MAHTAALSQKTLQGQGQLKALRSAKASALTMECSWPGNGPQSMGTHEQGGTQATTDQVANVRAGSSEGSAEPSVKRHTSGRFWISPQAAECSCCGICLGGIDNDGRPVRSVARGSL